jgi:SRSO17 transposase
MRPPLWHPLVELPATEQAIIRRIRRTKLFVFLPYQRHVLLSESFQYKLGTLHKDGLQSHPPVPPASLALATLLQAYSRVSADEVIEATMIALQRRLNIDTLTFSWYLFPHTQNSTRRQQMVPACRTAGEPVAIPQFALTRSDLDTFMDELRGFHTAFRGCFARQEPRDQFCHYMVGQFSPLERKSIEPLALQVEGGKVRAMQRRVSDALWDEDAMLETYHRVVQDEMGEADGVVIIDETGFAKKGHDSVGVARQYCGSLGKVEKCHVGVFAAYASRQGYALVDKRLFLPEPWFSDTYTTRRTKCKVPAELTWQSKPQLAAAMVRTLHEAGVLSFKYIVAECLSGNSPDFWEVCAACIGTVAFVATPADTRGGLQPLPTTPHTYPSKGEQRTKRRAAAPAPPPCPVAALAQAIPATFWYRRTVAEGTKGPITYEFARKRIRLCKEGQPTPAVWLLIKRTLSAHPRYWYYLSNAPMSAPFRLCVWLSGGRWAIEQCFEETQTALGMDPYEVRKYPGWHQHMLTCMLAHFFLWHLQLRLEKKSPSAYGLASPPVIGSGVASQSLPGG